jgi:hypothetical protein
VGQPGGGVGDGVVAADGAALGAVHSGQPDALPYVDAEAQIDVHVKGVRVHDLDEAGGVFVHGFLPDVQRRPARRWSL